VAEHCTGTSPLCPDDDNSVTDGNACQDPFDWTSGDACSDGTCTGVERGDCTLPEVVGELPFSDTNTALGRPSHISAYGSGCDISSGNGADVVYRLDVAAGDSYVVVLEPDTVLDGAVAVVAACDAGQACLAAANSGGVGDDEELNFTAGADGSVFVIVESVGTGGEFVLTVSAQAGDRPEQEGSGSAGVATGCSCDSSGDNGMSVLLAFLLVGMGLRRPAWRLNVSITAASEAAQQKTVSAR
jgi:hypothetical protein